MEKKPPLVKCPACGEKSIFSASNPWRPFCSQRCKSIDFGGWASEQFRVAGKLEDLEPEDFSELASQDRRLH